MKKIKLGINGFGRIGKTVFRAYLERYFEKFEVVAVNNPGVLDQHLFLLKHDTIMGTLSETIEKGEDEFSVKGQNVKFFKEYNPEKIPWSDLNVDIVIDATGVFTNGKDLKKHLGGTVKKVVLCAPGKEVDGTFVMGVNHELYSHKDHQIISNGSCTTNCLAPVLKTLDEEFGIESTMMTTVHSYTSDQNLLDGSHKKDFRRARAAALSMIPTSTGAAGAVGKVYPKLEGKVTGFAIRVPTPNVSLVDATINFKQKITKEKINSLLSKVSQEKLKGILSVTDQPLVSCDFMGNPHSSIIDLQLTETSGEKTAKVISWYDNEAGFSNRVLDLASYVGSFL